MSTLKELQKEFDKRAGIKDVQESDGRTREILDMKIKLEKIQNGINEIKGIPMSSPLLKESIQQEFDLRANVKDMPKKEKSDRELLMESLSQKSIKAKSPNKTKDEIVILKESHESVSLSDRVDIQESAFVAGEDTVEVVLIEAGTNVSKKRHYPEKTLKEAALLFSGLKMYLNHATPSELRQRPERDLRDWCATILESRYEGGKVLAKVALHDSWLKQRLVDPIARKGIGISINASGKVNYGKVNGKEIQIVEILDDLISVDFVSEAGAGGRINN